MEAETAADTAASLLKNGVRLVPPLAAMGLLLLLFGPATYTDATAGRMGDAMIGAVALLVLGGAISFWLYKRARSVRQRVEIG